MNRHTLNAAVDKHTCAVKGTVYRFRLEWTAVESSDGGHPTRLMQVEARAVSGRPHRCNIIHLLVQFHKTSELQSLLDDALHLSLKLDDSKEDRPSDAGVATGCAELE